MKTAGQERPAYFLYHSLWRALDWLFPPTCGGCSQLGLSWCKDCQQKVTRISGSICSCCGDPQPKQSPPDSTAPLLCPDCQAHLPVYQALRSYGEFRGPIRDALHRLKYQRDVGMGEALSKHLIELYNELKWDINIVTAVPLSPKRARERGYNQSALLARPLAYAIDKTYQPRAVQRSRDTRTQVGLSAKERQQNVDGAFTADEATVKGKVVLVIDDVMTTGSTISACAQALRKAGASAVYGLTLARAVMNTDTDDRPTISSTNGGKNGSRGRDLS
jgi:competence protein ComFC